MEAHLTASTRRSRGWPLAPGSTGSASHLAQRGVRLSGAGLVALREGQLRRLAGQGGSGTVLADLARDPNRFLATIQIVITLSGFFASASAAVTLAQPLVDTLGFLGNVAQPAAVVIVTLAIAYVTLVVGELAPKRLAMQRTEGGGLLIARPLSLLSVITRPVVWLLSRSADVVVRLLGGDPVRRMQEVTCEEVRDMAASSSSFSPEHSLILSGAFDISERSLRQVVRPDVRWWSSTSRCRRQRASPA